jgi:triosephosphate isomerase
MSSSASSKRRPQRTLGISLKLYFTPDQTFTYYQALTSLVALAESHNIYLFLIPSLITLPLLLQQNLPSNPNLAESRSSPKSSSIGLGAQDCSSYDSGAYTGEISPLELSLLGCQLVELGHAERRKLFGETDESVAKKAEAVLRNGMCPLICIGEKNFESVENAVKECEPQITSILDVQDHMQDLRSLKGKGEIIFAYEPVWAIGQSKPASAEYVVAVTQSLRRICTQRGRGGEIRIIYGGSAGPGTFEDMKDGVDGLFLGRFGHHIDSVQGVIEELGHE